MADDDHTQRFVYRESDLHVWVRGERMKIEEFERRKETGELTDEDLD